MPKNRNIFPRPSGGAVAKNASALALMAAIPTTATASSNTRATASSNSYHGGDDDYGFSFVFAAHHPTYHHHYHQQQQKLQLQLQQQHKNNNKSSYNNSSQQQTNFTVLVNARIDARSFRPHSKRLSKFQITHTTATKEEEEQQQLQKLCHHPHPGSSSHPTEYFAVLRLQNNGNNNNRRRRNTNTNTNDISNLLNSTVSFSSSSSYSSTSSSQYFVYAVHHHLMKQSHEDGLFFYDSDLDGRGHGRRESGTSLDLVQSSFRNNNDNDNDHHQQSTIGSTPTTTNIKTKENNDDDGLLFFDDYFSVNIPERDFLLFHLTDGSVDGNGDGGGAARSLTFYQCGASIIMNNNPQSQNNQRNSLKYLFEYPVSTTTTSSATTTSTKPASSSSGVQEEQEGDVETTMRRRRRQQQGDSLPPLEKFDTSVDIKRISVDAADPDASRDYYLSAWSGAAAGTSADDVGSGSHNNDRHRELKEYLLRMKVSGQPRIALTVKQLQRVDTEKNPTIVFVSSGYRDFEQDKFWSDVQRALQTFQGNAQIFTISGAGAEEDDDANGKNNNNNNQSSTNTNNNKHSNNVKNDGKLDSSPWPRYFPLLNMYGIYESSTDSGASVVIGREHRCDDVAKRSANTASATTATATTTTTSTTTSNAAAGGTSTNNNNNNAFIGNGCVESHVSRNNLGCAFGTPNPRYIGCDYRAVRALAHEAPDADVIITLVNDERYAGSGGGGMVTVTNGPDMPLLLIHELNHAMAGLGDEFSHGDDVEEKTDVARYLPPNCAVSAGDAAEKWAEMYSEPFSLPTSPSKGCVFANAYRPTDGDCLMRTKYPRMCPVCQQELNQRLLFKTPIPNNLALTYSDWGGDSSSGSSAVATRYASSISPSWIENTPSVSFAAPRCPPENMRVNIFPNQSVALTINHLFIDNPYMEVKWFVPTITGSIRTLRAKLPNIYVHGDVLPVGDSTVVAQITDNSPMLTPSTRSLLRKRLVYNTSFSFRVLTDASGAAMMKSNGGMTDGGGGGGEGCQPLDCMSSLGVVQRYECTQCTVSREDGCNPRPTTTPLPNFGAPRPPVDRLEGRGSDVAGVVIGLALVWLLFTFIFCCVHQYQKDHEPQEVLMVGPAIRRLGYACYILNVIVFASTVALIGALTYFYPNLKTFSSDIFVVLIVFCVLLLLTTLITVTAVSKRSVVVSVIGGVTAMACAIAICCAALLGFYVVINSLPEKTKTSGGGDGVVARSTAMAASLMSRSSAVAVLEWYRDRWVEAVRDRPADVCELQHWLQCSGLDFPCFARPGRVSFNEEVVSSYCPRNCEINNYKQNSCFPAWKGEVSTALTPTAALGLIVAFLGVVSGGLACLYAVLLSRKRRVAKGRRSYRRDPSCPMMVLTEAEMKQVRYEYTKLIRSTKSAASKGATDAHNELQHENAAVVERYRGWDEEDEETAAALPVDSADMIHFLDTIFPNELSLKDQEEIIRVSEQQLDLQHHMNSGGGGGISSTISPTKAANNARGGGANHHQQQQQAATAALSNQQLLSLSDGLNLFFPYYQNPPDPKFVSEEEASRCVDTVELAQKHYQKHEQFAQACGTLSPEQLYRLHQNFLKLVRRSRQFQKNKMYKKEKPHYHNGGSGDGGGGKKKRGTMLGQGAGTVKERALSFMSFFSSGQPQKDIVKGFKVDGNGSGTTGTGTGSDNHHGNNGNSSGNSSNDATTMMMMHNNGDDQNEVSHQSFDNNNNFGMSSSSSTVVPPIPPPPPPFNNGDGTTTNANGHSHSTSPGLTPRASALGQQHYYYSQQQRHYSTTTTGVSPTKQQHHQRSMSGSVGNKITTTQNNGGNGKGNGGHNNNGAARKSVAVVAATGAGYYDSDDDDDDFDLTSATVDSMSYIDIVRQAATAHANSEEAAMCKGLTYHDLEALREFWTKLKTYYTTSTSAASSAVAADGTATATSNSKVTSSKVKSIQKNVHERYLTFGELEVFFKETHDLQPNGRSFVNQEHYQQWHTLLDVKGKMQACMYNNNDSSNHSHNNSRSTITIGGGAGSGWPMVSSSGSQSSHNSSFAAATAGGNNTNTTSSSYHASAFSGITWFEVVFLYARRNLQRQAQYLIHSDGEVSRKCDVLLSQLFGGGSSSNGGGVPSVAQLRLQLQGIGGDGDDDESYTPPNPSSSTLDTPPPPTTQYSNGGNTANIPPRTLSKSEAHDLFSPYIDIDQVFLPYEKEVPLERLLVAAADAS